MTGLERFGRMLPVIALLLGFLILRIINIDTWLPFFVDEVRHIDRARRVLSFSNLQISTTPGKILLYYYLSPFDLPQFDPMWLARSAALIFTLVGAAGTYVLSKTLFSHRAGLLSLVVLAVFPFMSFHDRMALTDPMTASFVVLVTWWSIIVVRRPTMQRTTVLAMLVCLMLLAKIVSIPFMAVPFLAIIFFSASPIQYRKNIVRQIIGWWEAYRPFIMRVIYILAVIWIPLLLFYLGRLAFVPESTYPIVEPWLYGGIDPDTEEIRVIDAIEANVYHIGDMMATMWGLLLLLPTGIGALYLLRTKPNTVLYLLLAIALYWATLLMVNNRPVSRYYSLAGHLWVVLVAGASWQIYRDYARHALPHRMVAAIPVGLIAAWVALYGLPYNLQMMNDPLKLTVTSAEQRHYFSNFTGYALVDAVEDVAERPALPPENDRPMVYLAMRLCRYVPYHIDETTNAELFCPRTLPKDYVEDINEALAEYGSMYLIREQFLEFDVDTGLLDANVEHLSSFQRPYDGVVLDVFRIEHPDGGVQTAEELP